MIYLNAKTSQGTETIDQIDRKDFETFREYKKEIRNLIENYRLIGLNVYKSQRPCKNW